MKQLDRYLIAPHQLDALRADGRGHNLILEILIFLGVTFVAFFGEGVLQLLFLLAATLLSAGRMTPDQLPTGALTEDITQLLYALVPESALTVISLFSTLGMIVITLVFLRFVFRRKLSTAGFTRPVLGEYLAGLLAGFVLFALAVGIAAATGSLRLDGLSPSFAPGLFLLLFLGFLIQGMSEELLCRGYFMLSVARKGSVAAGILANSVAFACLHLLNSGIRPLAMVNLILFGLFASLYYLWRGNIWGVAALHSMWNFTQGNIFGILVSGGSFGTSLFTSTSLPSGTLWNGGAFGLEGGLAVTAVLVLGILFVLWRNLRRIARAAESA